MQRILVIEEAPCAYWKYLLYYGMGKFREKQKAYRAGCP